MLYIERQPGKRSVALLAILGLLLYAGALYVFELRASDEGLQAAMAREIVSTGDYLKTHLYGRQIREYPLYSWLVTICSGFGSPTVWSLRLPSILCVFGLAIVSGISARRLQSPFSGYIAAAVVLMSTVSFHVGFRAQTEYLQAFLTFSAWWSWYHYGVNEKQWNRAWMVSLALVFIGILNSGLESVFWFYLPLLFMPRQVNAKMRMQMPAHIVSVLVVLALVFIWEWVTPDQPLMPWSQEPGLLNAPHDNSGYFWHFISFPWKMLYYLLPWSILIWAPFCVALRQFEHSPQACRFLRIIINVIFVCVWLFPGTSPLHLLPLLGPIAVLIGIHYEIVIRRYQHILNRMLHIVGWLVATLCLLASLFWLSVGIGLVYVEDIGPGRVWVSMILMGTIAVVFWALVLRRENHSTFRSSIIWCIFSAQALLLCTVDTYRQWNNSDRRIAGETLAGLHPAADASEPPPAVTLQQLAKSVDRIYYKPPRNNRNLYFAEFFWLGSPLVYMGPKDDWEKGLPEDEERVYVLNTHVPPVTNREWRPISPVVDIKLRRRPSLTFSNWDDGKPYVRIQRVADHPESRPQMNLQLFEGVRLKETSHDSATK